ncbi:FkbM family methyltransferase [Nocardia camponoti]|uniref:Methyltransferase FkbM domain-containing protein n=1 Tax=Nocardia camponoti TaxID=1616106 RepID=A0A917V3Z4_9NOCA|nr:FkbM family methyltransferase [Nocardia camponoti]GGK33696.1 hypothetical protein GCM10011591_01730 [Nocardia camponoti]
MTTAAQQLRLDDGRSVACISPAEARMLWNEMVDDGFYRQAAATLRPGDVALDIGANIGLSAMMFADTAPGVRVIAAEPAPLTYDCLHRNMSAHVPGGLALEAAIGAEPGVLPFTVYPRATANSSLYADKAADDEATRVFLRNSGLPDDAITMITEGLHDGEQIDVEVTTVSALLAKHDPTAEVGVLKIDVERAEFDVLMGIDDADWPRIRSVVAEVHDRNNGLARFCDVLTARGFTTRARQDPSLAGTELHEVYATRD